VIARHDLVIDGHVAPGGAAGNLTTITGEIDVADRDLVLGRGIKGPGAGAEESVRRGGRCRCEGHQCGQGGGQDCPFS